MSICVAPASAAAQALTGRTPNLSGGWTGPAGALHFNFLHRFNHSGPPQRQVVNRPTFLLAGAPLAGLLGGVQYATRSDVVAGVPNEWEVFARYRIAGTDSGGVALGAAWNDAARSGDAELSAIHSRGGLRLLASLRYLGSGYGSSSRLFGGAGVVVPLGHGFALAADGGSLLDPAEGERAAFGLGLHGRVPSSPHTFSLQAVTTNSATLQGSSRGADRIRWGFEFTIPITPARWRGRDVASAAVRADADVAVVTIRNMAYQTAALSVARGTTVVWRNEDSVMHTVTASDGSWDSGPIEPGGEWRRTFDGTGSIDYVCTPHPFMRGRIEVR